MSLKYRIGAAYWAALQELLRSRAFPLTRYFPRGICWPYDVQRFAGTRHFRTIFDVGANVGQTAGGLLKFFPTAEIHSFEPVSASFNTLQQRFGTKVRCHRLALGSERANLDIKLCNDSELNSFASVSKSGESDTAAVERVAVETIDNFCAEHTIDQIDILKMDVQGWELEVLRGAASMLSRNKVRFIFSEVGFRRGDVEMVMFDELHDAMTESGFVFSGFYDFYRHGAMKEYTFFGNALYLNPTFLGEIGPVKRQIE